MIVCRLMRHVVTENFRRFLDKYGSSIKSVGVVGGTSGDPEVAEIKSVLPETKFCFFNLENERDDDNFYKIDINTISIEQLENEKFDLVISSQVLEHIWNHDNYFKLLVKLGINGGLIWLNCPKSNMVHGSPDFYSAGFTSSYLSKNLEKFGCDILLAQEIGNKRYYMAVHFARYWQSKEENRHPLLNYKVQPGSVLGIIRKFLVDMPSRILLTFVPRNNAVNTEFASESFVGARTQISK